MRQKQFPNVYTTWPTMKDVKASDAEYITAYQSYMASGDLISAANALDNLKNKIMYTSDWQERYDVCDEMLEYLGQANITKYIVQDTAPTSTEYSIWLDTKNTSIALTDIVLTDTTFSYQFGEGQSTTLYVGVNRIPSNATPPDTFVIATELEPPLDAITWKNTNGFTIHYNVFTEPTREELTKTYTWTVLAKVGTELIGTQYTITVTLQRHEELECTYTYTYSGTNTEATVLELFQTEFDYSSSGTWTNLIKLIGSTSGTSYFYIPKPKDTTIPLRLTMRLPFTTGNVDYWTIKNKTTIQIFGSYTSNIYGVWIKDATKTGETTSYSIYQFTLTTELTSLVFKTDKPITVNINLDNTKCDVIINLIKE